MDIGFFTMPSHPPERGLRSPPRNFCFTFSAASSGLAPSSTREAPVQCTDFPVLDSHLVTCEGTTLEDFRGGGFLPSHNI